MFFKPLDGAQGQMVYLPILFLFTEIFVYDALTAQNSQSNNRSYLDTINP